MTRITGSEAQEPRQAILRLTGLFVASRPSRGRVAQVYAPIHPQFCRLADTNSVEQPQVSCIVHLCFGARKRNEAWNPGNFGCRGLRVYGPSGLPMPVTRTWFRVHFSSRAERFRMDAE